MPGFSIAAPDSIGAFAAKTCHEYQAPSSAFETSHMTIGIVPYTMGVEPQPRTQLPGYDSGVLCLLIGVFILLAFNCRHYSTFVKNFAYDLWSVRRTDSTLTVRTMSETGIQISMVLLTSLCQGIVINSALETHSLSTPLNTFSEIAAFTVLSSVYYLWQLAAYSTVGYIFTDSISARLWLKGFNASQALLGLALAIPALGVLFNPSYASWVIPLAISLYILARLIFISKGFRLFYENFGSLLYFILYLCTLEIVPLVIIVRLVVLSSSFF